jgi:hypothetical protein
MTDSFVEALPYLIVLAAAQAGYYLVGYIRAKRSKRKI